MPPYLCIVVGAHLRCARRSFCICLHKKGGIKDAATCRIADCPLWGNRRSKRRLRRSEVGGGSRIRTGDMLLAKQPLYQLSYTPSGISRVGLTRIELVTSSLSGTRSNQLSYKPIVSVEETRNRRPISELANCEFANHCVVRAVSSAPFRAHSPCPIEGLSP